MLYLIVSYMHSHVQQEYWSGLPFYTPGNLPDPGIEPVSHMFPSLVDEFFTTVPPGIQYMIYLIIQRSHLLNWVMKNQIIQKRYIFCCFYPSSCFLIFYADYSQEPQLTSLPNHDKRIAQ